MSFDNKLKKMKKYANDAEKGSINYANYQHLMRRRLDKNASVENLNF